MNQQALEITRYLCVLTLIITSSVSLVAVQKQTVQARSAQKASGDEIVEKLNAPRRRCSAAGTAPGAFNPTKLLQIGSG